MSENTIAAISTPIGTGGVSIVRVSGTLSKEIAQKLFICDTIPGTHKQAMLEPRKLVMGTFLANTFKERCLTVYFPAPNSYTGEDVVEFQCHGGIVIAQGILNTVLNHGAVLAQPGEFSKRAFLNGKMSLDEAEGVMDMIHAESETEVRAGYQLLQGGLHQEIQKLQDDLTTMIAKIEVTLDYPEVDYEEQTAQELKITLNQIMASIKDILATSATGMLIKNGTRILIVGKPNVGKSSLLNAMLNYDRAIVTSVKGTTRDTIEETYLYNGVKFIITDTAGLRESTDEVEKIGIDKTKKAILQSDICLLVLDASEPLSGEDEDIMKLLVHKPTLVVLNKTDLPTKIDISKLPFSQVLSISALNKKGITQLKDTIYNLVIDQKMLNSTVLITNMRHVQALQTALQHGERALEGIDQKLSLDLISIDLKNLWLTLGDITGNSNNEEIIDRIFSRFCLGK